MNLKIIFYLAAFGMGLALPFQQLLFKIILTAIVYFMDAALSDESEKRKYSIYLLFIIGILLSYLYKLFVN